MHLRNKIIMLLFVSLFALNAGAASRASYKPFVLAYTTSGTLDAVAADVSAKLSNNGFDVVGSYAPYKNAQIVIVTNDALKQAAAQTEFGGYGAMVRVGITKVNDEVQVSYTNPIYMFHAYRMEGESTVDAVADKLGKVLGDKDEFGTEKALSKRKLRKYHYMFGMEYFDQTDVHFLAEHRSHADAVKIIEDNLAKGKSGVYKVYRIDIPGTEQTVIGIDIDRERGADNAISDDFIMEQIDFNPLKATAHLPVEILVVGNKAYSLYYRFRIAINFPELSMMGENSFMNIVESPEKVKTALIGISGGEVLNNYWAE